MLVCTRYLHNRFRLYISFQYSHNILHKLEVQCLFSDIVNIPYLGNNEILRLYIITHSQSIYSTHKAQIDVSHSHLWILAVFKK